MNSAATGGIFHEVETLNLDEPKTVKSKNLGKVVFVLSRHSSCAGPGTPVASRRTKRKMTTTGLNRTFGLPTRKCLRVGSLLGLILSVLHVAIGSILVVFVLQVIRTRDENREEYNKVYEQFMLYKGNDSLLFILSVILIALNLNQIISDILVFNATLSGGRRKLLWLHFLLGVIVWLGSLICFILIFSAGGLILLLTCLAATGIRTYLLFTLHQFIGLQRKSNDITQEMT